MLYHREVVGDKHICQFSLFLKILHQIQDLGLNGNVQRGNRFIADHKFRIQAQGPGDADPLASSSVQFVRIASGQPSGQPHCIHQLQNPLFQLVLRLAGLVDDHALRDGVMDAHSWIQGRKRILKNHLQLSSQIHSFLSFYIGNILAVEYDISRRALQKPYNGAAKGGFSASGLSHDSQGPSSSNRKIQTVHRVEHSLGRLKIFFQFFYL